MNNIYKCPVPSPHTAPVQSRPISLPLPGILIWAAPFPPAPPFSKTLAQTILSLPTVLWPSSPLILPSYSPMLLIIFVSKVSPQPALLLWGWTTSQPSTWPPSLPLPNPWAHPAHIAFLTALPSTMPSLLVAVGLSLTLLDLTGRVTAIEVIQSQCLLRRKQQHIEAWYFKPMGQQKLYLAHQYQNNQQYIWENNGVCFHHTMFAKINPRWIKEIHLFLIIKVLGENTGGYTQSQDGNDIRKREIQNPGQKEGPI